MEGFIQASWGQFRGKRMLSGDVRSGVRAIKAAEDKEHARVIEQSSNDQGHRPDTENGKGEQKPDLQFPGGNGNG